MTTELQKGVVASATLNLMGTKLVRALASSQEEDIGNVKLAI
jgi:hypothetical protein